MEDQKVENKVLSEILGLIKEVIIILVVVWLIKSFVLENTKVIGQSMEPTLHENNAVIVNKFIYHFSEPDRGDIIVFPYSGDPSKHYIKRIIGLPGETVDIQQGSVYVNEMPLQEPYILEQMQQRGDMQFPMVIPEGTYFVMGDNRNNSSDSRYKDVGTVEKDKIIGHAVLRVWPLNQFGTLE